MDYDPDQEARVLKDAVRAFPVEWFVQDEWRIARHALADLAALALGAWITLRWPATWVCFPVWVLMAGRLHALGVLMHDLSHVRHLEHRPLHRTILDALVSWPILMNVDYYKYAHELHHRWSNIPGKDPYFLQLNRMDPVRFVGFVLASTAFLPLWLTLRLVSFPLALVFPAVRRFHVRYFTQFGAAADLTDPERLADGERVWGWAAGPSACWWAIGLALTSHALWLPFLWAYGVPLVLSGLVGQVRLACDHVLHDARDTSIPEQLRWSTNIEAPWWQAIVLAPHGAAYHGMHHVAPGVPSWHWRDAHVRLKASGSRAYALSLRKGYGQVLRELVAEQVAWARGAPAPSIGLAEPAGVSAAPKAPEAPEMPAAPARVLSVPALEDINASARKHAFALSDIAWRPIDRTRPFAPESLSHLYYTPAYAELDPEERLTYNQAVAQGVAEQFVFLEQVLLVRGLKAYLSAGGAALPAALREACEGFIEEEEKHSQMFHRLLAEADPEHYERSPFHVYRLSGAEQRFLDASVEYPTVYLWWIWIATLFEEKTLDFHRRYSDERDRVDPMYAEVHKLHAKDELRHLQLDHHFVDALWATAPAWKRELNAWLFRRVMWSFVHPRRTVIAAVRALVARHPRLAPRQDELVAAGMGVCHDRTWHEATYSRRTLPSTFALFDRFPEMHVVATVLPLYRPVAVS